MNESAYTRIIGRAYPLRGYISKFHLQNSGDIDHYKKHLPQEWDMVKQTQARDNEFFARYHIGYMCHINDDKVWHGHLAQRFKQCQGYDVGGHYFCRTTHWLPNWGPLTRNKAAVTRAIQQYWVEYWRRRFVLLHHLHSIPHDIIHLVMQYLRVRRAPRPRDAMDPMVSSRMPSRERSRLGLEPSDE